MIGLRTPGPSQSEYRDAIGLVRPRPTMSSDPEEQAIDAGAELLQ